MPRPGSLSRLDALPRLGSTIARLAEGQRNWAKVLRVAGAAPGAAAQAGPSRLQPVKGFGSDPGDLEMFVHTPDRLAPRPGLVVVLHGCTQTAAGYDHGSGWSALADRHGFVLVYPQQRQANNPKACFNWFQPGDIGRDHGEALSIRQMVERVVVDHGIDRSRIFVTGLSAGGAMTAVMLATYPEIFAGGAVIAGLPYGGALNVQDALGSMFQGRGRDAREWGDLVRAASDHAGPWPTLSIWHGAADAVVKPENATELAKQWTDLHGIALQAAEHDSLGAEPRDVWRDETGRVVVESITIAGMGHGTPLAVGTGTDQGGAAGPFMLDVGLSSSHHIARFLGLDDVVVARPETAAPTAQPVPTAPSPSIKDGARTEAPPKPFDIAATINNALRTAGLLKR